MGVDIVELEKRIEAIEDVIADVVGGNYDANLVVDDGYADPFCAVETGVSILIADLGAEVRANQKRARELEEKLAVIQEQLAIIESQRRAIQDLSTPVLQLWDDVLALPIIGVVDTERSVQIMETLLTEVTLRQAHYVILDITGVEMVDTKTADHLLKVVLSVQLLGASCILTGIRPAVAQTMVELGVDMSALMTLRTMRDGLAECMRRSYRKNADGGRLSRR